MKELERRMNEIREEMKNDARLQAGEYLLEQINKLKQSLLADLLKYNERFESGKWTKERLEIFEEQTKFFMDTLNFWVGAIKGENTTWDILQECKRIWPRIKAKVTSKEKNELLEIQNSNDGTTTKEMLKNYLSKLVALAAKHDPRDIEVVGHQAPSSVQATKVYVLPRKKDPKKR